MACGTVSVYDENDLWARSDRTDRYYTHGTRVSMILPATRPTPETDADAQTAPGDDGSSILRTAVARLPFYDEERTTQIGFVLGQEMYTPADTTRRDLITDDRPYAGWSYVGLLVANASRRAREHAAGDHVQTFEIDAGIVGPHSYAQDAQDFVHRTTGVRTAKGWNNQLRDEFGIVASYERRDRLVSVGETRGPGGDLIGSLGGSVGNVLTEARAGITARIGWDLPRDFGVNTIHTTAVEVPDVDRDGWLHGYVFAGVDGHAVAHSIFLDGNTFQDGPSVDRRPLVAELRLGFALELGNLRLAYTSVNRSKEFEGQPASAQFGSLSLTFTIGF